MCDCPIAFADPTVMALLKPDAVIVWPLPAIRYAPAAPVPSTSKELALLIEMVWVPTVDTIDAPNPLLAPVLLTTMPWFDAFIPLVVMLCAPFVLVIVVEVAGPCASTSTHCAGIG